jgi:alanine dehydrogenase
MNVGLPRMHKEAGDRRDFLPRFVAALDAAGATAITLEEGYGTGMDVPASAYEGASSRVRFGSYEDCLAQDLVAVVRCPDEPALRMLRRGTILLSMLHYPSWPARARLLADMGVRAVSMDGIVDDRGRRLIEAMEAVGWNGVQAAFREIAALHPAFRHPGRRPVHVTCLGAGAVGGHAIRAATRYGDPELREELVSKQVPGVEVTVADFDLTWHRDYMLSRLQRTDLLIDATQRVDFSRPVVPNEWIAEMPPDAVLLDLSADTYAFSVRPTKTKGIEGIPEGNLDQWIFHVDDPAYERLDPRVRRVNRRLALSCYAWPGVKPRECMQTYGSQLEPIVELIIADPSASWEPHDGSYEQRAVARAEVTTWLTTAAA